MISLTTLIFLVGVIAACVNLTSAIEKGKTLMLEKGVSDDTQSYLAVSIWGFPVPFFMGLLFPSTFVLAWGLYYVLFFVPAIVIGTGAAKVMGVGFDYQRRIGRDLWKVVALGYAGIGWVILTSFFTNLFTQAIRK